MSGSGVATVLLLGGTAEARRLGERLAAEPSLRVVSSLAGRTREPLRPSGDVRVGGFGGPEGLERWIRSEGVQAVADATHPFAARISASAAQAADACGVPILALRRPGWFPAAGDDWRWADSLEQAAESLEALGRRFFLTVGRQSIAPFARSSAWFLVRCIDAPGPPTPRHMTLILDRGPFSVAGECELLRRFGIDALVSKDSGGSATAAKLTAARELGVPVVMVRRPPLPPVSTVATVEEAAAALLRIVHAG